MHTKKHYTFLKNYTCFLLLFIFPSRLAVLEYHIELLQTIISNCVTRHFEVTEDISGEEVTAQCLTLSLTLARNLCAGVQHNQTMLW